ncbi:MAG TPA: formate dehydrogenase accessory sulfurtransferase FdhD, partial [Myxococcota bacterium]|nr:formate dehydrogenase accessory sulfurtransferase FdhD [Myxococcota bacterium]
KNVFTKGSDEVAIEQALNLELVYGPLHNRNIYPLTTMMRTPGADVELARGLLFSLGIINSASDVVDALMCERSKFQPDAIEKLTIALSPYVTFSPMNFMENLPRQTSCGACSSVYLPKIMMIPKTIGPQWSWDTLRTLPKKMSLRQEIFNKTGGVHAAALFMTNGDMVSIFEDIGRHNALDKLIGHLLVDPQIFSGCALLLSSRASFEMVQKAARANIPVLAVMGAVSSMAVKWAKESGLTLIGFLKEDRCNVYTHKHRIEEYDVI